MRNGFRSNVYAATQVREIRNKINSPTPVKVERVAHSKKELSAPSFILYCLYSFNLVAFFEVLVAFEYEAEPCHSPKASPDFNNAGPNINSLLEKKLFGIFCLDSLKAV